MRTTAYKRTENLASKKRYKKDFEDLERYDRNAKEKMRPQVKEERKRSTLKKQQKLDDMGWDELMNYYHLG